MRFFFSTGAPLCWNRSIWSSSFPRERENSSLPSSSSIPFLWQPVRARRGRQATNESERSAMRAGRAVRHRRAHGSGLPLTCQSLGGYIDAHAPEHPHFPPGVEARAGPEGAHADRAAHQRARADSDGVLRTRSFAERPPSSARGSRTARTSTPSFRRRTRWCARPRGGSWESGSSTCSSWAASFSTRAGSWR